MGSSGLSTLPVVYQDLGSSGVPPAGHALRAEVGGGITFVTSGENTKKSINTAYKFLGDLCGFYDVGAIYASLSGTAQSPWLLCILVFLD